MPLNLVTPREVAGTLSRNPANVALARKAARLALEEWGLSDHVEVIELVVSELVTNAVRHGDGRVRMRMSVAADQLRVEVHDDGCGRPIRRHAGVADESGRGLELLGDLAVLHDGELGVTDDEPGYGKTVWFAVPLSLA